MRRPCRDHGTEPRYLPRVPQVPGFVRHSQCTSARKVFPHIIRRARRRSARIFDRSPSAQMAVGRPVEAGNFLRRHYRPLLKRLGFPPVRFHDLRHTAATLLLLQGIHPKIVSEMLGHASVSITLDLYSHVLPDMQRDAIEAMARLFEGATDGKLSSMRTMRRLTRERTVRTNS